MDGIDQARKSNNRTRMFLSRWRAKDSEETSKTAVSPAHRLRGKRLRNARDRDTEKRRERERKRRKGREGCNLVEIVSRCILESPPSGFGRGSFHGYGTLCKKYL